MLCHVSCIHLEIGYCVQPRPTDFNLDRLLLSIVLFTIVFGYISAPQQAAQGATPAVVQLITAAAVTLTGRQTMQVDVHVQCHELEDLHEGMFR